LDVKFIKEKSKVSNLVLWSRVSQRIIKRETVKAVTIPQYKESIIKQETLKTVAIPQYKERIIKHEIVNVQYRLVE
jgi:hypothetical protein